MKILVIMSSTSLESFPLGSSEDREVAQKILFLEFQMGYLSQHLGCSNQIVIRNAPEEKKNGIH